MADINITLDATKAIKAADTLDTKLQALEKLDNLQLKLSLSVEDMESKFKKIKSRLADLSKEAEILLHTKLREAGLRTQYNKIKSTISAYSKAKPIILHTRLAKRMTKDRRVEQELRSAGSAAAGFTDKKRTQQEIAEDKRRKEQSKIAYQQHIAEQNYQKKQEQYLMNRLRTEKEIGKAKEYTAGIEPVNERQEDIKKRVEQGQKDRKEFSEKEKEKLKLNEKVHESMVKQGIVTEDLKVSAEDYADAIGDTEKATKNATKAAKEKFDIEKLSPEKQKEYLDIKDKIAKKEKEIADLGKRPPSQQVEKAQDYRKRYSEIAKEKDELVGLADAIEATVTGQKKGKKSSEEYENAMKNQGNAVTEASKKHKGFEKTIERIDGLLKRHGNTRKELVDKIQKVKDNLAKEKAAYDNSEKGIWNNLKARWDLRQAIKKANKDIKDHEKSLRSMGGGMGILTSAFGKLTMGLTAVAATLFIFQEISQWFRGFVKIGSDYIKTLSMIQAETRLAANETDRFVGLLKGMAKGTSAGIQDIYNAYKGLRQAGLSHADAMQKSVTVTKMLKDDSMKLDDAINIVANDVHGLTEQYTRYADVLADTPVEAFAQLKRDVREILGEFLKADAGFFRDMIKDAAGILRKYLPDIIKGFNVIFGLIYGFAQLLTVIIVGLGKIAKIVNNIAKDLPEAFKITKDFFLEPLKRADEFLSKLSKIKELSSPEGLDPYPSLKPEVKTDERIAGSGKLHRLLPEKEEEVPYIPPKIKDILKAHAQIYTTTKQMTDYYYDEEIKKVDDTYDKIGEIIKFHYKQYAVSGVESYKKQAEALEAYAEEYKDLETFSAGQRRISKDMSDQLKLFQQIGVVSAKYYAGANMYHQNQQVVLKKEAEYMKSLSPLGKKLYMEFKEYANEQIKLAPIMKEYQAIFQATGHYAEAYYENRMKQIDQEVKKMKIISDSYKDRYIETGDETYKSHADELDREIAAYKELATFAESQKAISKEMKDQLGLFQLIGTTASKYYKEGTQYFDNEITKTKMRAKHMEGLSEEGKKVYEQEVAYINKQKELAPAMKDYLEIFKLTGDFSTKLYENKQTQIDHEIQAMKRRGTLQDEWLVKLLKEWELRRYSQSERISSHQAFFDETGIMTRFLFQRKMEDAEETYIKKSHQRQAYEPMYYKQMYNKILKLHMEKIKTELDLEKEKFETLGTASKNYFNKQIEQLMLSKEQLKTTYGLSEKDANAMYDKWIQDFISGYKEPYIDAYKEIYDELSIITDAYYQEKLYAAKRDYDYMVRLADGNKELIALADQLYEREKRKAAVEELETGKTVDEGIIAGQERLMLKSEPLAKRVSDAWVSGAASIEQAWKSQFFDVMEMNFDNLGDAALGFLKSIQKMLIDVLYQQVMYGDNGIITKVKGYASDIIGKAPEKSADIEASKGNEETARLLNQKAIEMEKMSAEDMLRVYEAEVIAVDKLAVSIRQLADARALAASSQFSGFQEFQDLGAEIANKEGYKATTGENAISLYKQDPGSKEMMSKIVETKTLEESTRSTNAIAINSETTEITALIGMHQAESASIQTLITDYYALAIAKQAAGVGGTFGLGGGAEAGATRLSTGAIQNPSGVVWKMASGGWITEPILGVGTRTGRGYSLGEKGPELVSPQHKVQGGGGQGVPNVKVEVMNQTGVDSDAKQGEVRWDGDQWVVGVVMDAYNRDRYGMRSMMKR